MTRPFKLGDLVLLAISPGDLRPRSGRVSKIEPRIGGYIVTMTTHPSAGGERREWSGSPSHFILLEACDSHANPEENDMIINPKLDLSVYRGLIRVAEMFDVDDAVSIYRRLPGAQVRLDNFFTVIDDVDRRIAELEHTFTHEAMRDLLYKRLKIIAPSRPEPTIPDRSVDVIMGMDVDETDD